KAVTDAAQEAAGQVGVGVDAEDVGKFGMWLRTVVKAVTNRKGSVGGAVGQAGGKPEASTSGGTSQNPNSTSSQTDAEAGTLVQRNVLGRSPNSTSGGMRIDFDGEFYSVDGLKFSKSYYERLWRQGHPAAFLQAREVLNSNPKIIPDPRGAAGYFKYEGAGLEMIYNPSTGQVGLIQPIRVK
ncbi:hypothetical protein ACE1YR_20495, partial [Pseudomonas sp. K1(2024)]